MFRDLIQTTPADRLALLFAVASVGAVVLGILILKPILRLAIGRGDPTINDSIGYGTASFSLFYALLLGLLTVAAYQNKDRVEQSVLTEAGAVGGLYASMNSYPEPTRSDVKALLRDYVLFTIHRDWPAHRQGTYLDGGTNRMDAIRQRLTRFTPSNPGQEILHAETVSAFSHFAEARQQRLNGLITRIPDVLWYAVLVGAALNILILILLRMRLLAHLILGAISAFFLGVVLYVIAVLDDPLRSSLGVQPTAFQLLWDRQMVWDESIG
ncbi:DUF4239 domain-containing protein [Rubellimicrobium arenae]|uniref:bestrophin-like domain n=1 Tax=Rubellimicrobium arenae TaxID=2817372 RepID=UPI001B30096A|nr:DUF4239 domain-containing protein [Rubellimicrobium arenae]